MQKLKRFFSSSLNRVILLIFAVLIPLNLLTLVLGRRVIAESEKQIGLELQHTLTLYLNLADEATRRVDTHLALLAIDDPDYLRLRDKEIDSEEERYRQLQAVVDLQINLKKKREDEFLISGIFAYFPEKEIFAQQSGYALRAVTVRDRIREEIGKGYGASLRGCRLLTAGEQTVLAAVSDHRGVWYGSWIELSDIARHIPLEEGRILAFTDREGHILYASEDLPETLDLQSDRQKIGEESYLISAAAAPSGEFYALELVPDRQISGALPFAIRLLQLLSVAAVIALPILLLAMQHWVVSPVAQLNRAIETVEGGDLDYRIPEREQGTEFNRINRSFNHMMDQVEELKISVYEEQLQAQKIKMGFLAQQIKPHFILNTLNILYSYEREEFPLIQKMILYLSRYFRYVVNAHQDFVTLGQEMEHLRNYFAIQKLRFVQTFEATVDYDEELYDCLVPPLLLQSFAENAIKHALIPDTIVQIRVSAEKTEAGRLLLRVTDTGPGITDEVLERIEQFRKEHRFRRDLGVGIQNAIDRVELLYSGAGSVELSRRPEGGTAVEIELPFLKMHSRLADADEETA